MSQQAHNPHFTANTPVSITHQRPLNPLLDVEKIEQEIASLHRDYKITSLLSIALVLLLVGVLNVYFYQPL